MAVVQTIAELREILHAHPGRIIGLDVGEKTIGVAISDRGMKIASPKFTLERASRKKDAQKIIDFCTEQEVVGMVIGLPLNMDSTEGTRCVVARMIGGLFTAITNMPIFYQDERFSTMGMERELIAIDMTRKRRGEIIDKLAASKILQTALDQIAT